MDVILVNQFRRRDCRKEGGKRWTIESDSGRVFEGGGEKAQG